MSEATKEQWREVPGHPRYSLSNLGRMKGPCGQLTPGMSSGSQHSARYQVHIEGSRRQTTVNIRVAMGQIWDIAFTPTEAWVQSIRDEVKAAVKRGAQSARGRSTFTAPAPFRPKLDVMPCPWGGGLMEQSALPAGVESWDCAEMDPMTARGENGVWIYVPKSAAERRKIRYEVRQRKKRNGRMAA